MRKTRRNSTLKYILKETDWFLLIACIITSAFGALMVYSATYRSIPEGSFIAKECLSTILGSLIGICIGFIISNFEYELFLRLSPIIAIVGIILLVGLFKFGWAPPDRPDSKCWYDLKVIYFQPSELVKIGFIITFATHLDSVKEELNSIKNVALLCLHGLVPTGLVILTGDLGSALVFLVIFVGMMFMAGLNLRYFAVAGVGAIVAAPILWIKFFAEHQKNRFLAIYYPSALTEEKYKSVIYQQERGLRAIGSGMLKGDGFLKGALTQSGYVPVNGSDMIFTVIAEELGFFGCIFLLAALTVIVLRLSSDGKKSANFSGNLICTGVALMIASQSIINIGMCLALLPCIGITLPFISSGGSSNMCVYLGIGLALSVYRFNCDREPVSFRVRNISTPFREN